MKFTREQLQEKTRLIEAVVGEYQHLSAACRAAEKAGCLDPNGPLFEAIWTTWDRMLDRIDTDGWLLWYIYENDCGAKGFEASADHHRWKPRPIRSARQLAVVWLRAMRD